MSSVGNILLEKEILLESGTNELEILVFRVADCIFGINVAKVREVLPAQSITNLPKAHPSIVGVFKLRDIVVPCVSLHQHLNLSPPPTSQESTLILTDFNMQQTAFVVDEVEKIHRLSWKYILPVPGLISLATTPVTAVAKIKERLIIMLDFEMVSDQVTEQFYRTGPIENPLDLPRKDLRILLADDSPTVREAVGTTLRSSGYTNLHVFKNGAELWDWLEQNLHQGSSEDSVADLVISDVEMPQIDGFHLTKKIKEHPQLKNLPVLLYSSIVSADNHKKGVAVGADAQVSKPELSKVVHLADELILKSQKAIKQNQPPQEIQKTTQRKTPKEQVTSASEPEKTQPSSAEPPAKKIDEGLLKTFRTELSDRVQHLNELCNQRSAGDLDQVLVNDTFRTLHTIKSASMVVPVDQVTRVTHLIESLLELTRQDAQQWPTESLGKYSNWLADFADIKNDSQVILQQGLLLEKELVQ